MRDVAFTLGPLTIHWYGVMLALGFLAAFWTAARRARSTGVSPDLIYDLVPWLMISAVIGARAVYVATYWEEEFAGKPWADLFAVQRGGLVFYGGFVGACIGTIIFARRKKTALWQLADITAPSVALGQFFGRIGCLLHGCCYGRTCDAPWAIHFPANHATHGAGVHPTQIYEAALALALSILLAKRFQKRSFDGQVFASYLIGYAFIRSLVENFRGDYPQHQVVSGLTPGQLVSLGIFSAGMLLLWKLPRTKSAAA